MCSTRCICRVALSLSHTVCRSGSWWRWNARGWYARWRSPVWRRLWSVPCAIATLAPFMVGSTTDIAEMAEKFGLLVRSLPVLLVPPAGNPWPSSCKLFAHAWLIPSVSTKARQSRRSTKQSRRRLSTRRELFREQTSRTATERTGKHGA